MPVKKYRVELDGRTFELEGDHPPTEAEAREAIGAHLQTSAPAQAQAEPIAPPERPSLLHRIGTAAYEASPLAAFKTAAEHPVQAGAMLGGLVAAPVTGGTSIPAAMAAAGLGAAGGAGLGSVVEQLQHGPSKPTDVLKTMGTEGALSAAGEGVGQGLIRAVKPIAKLVYKTALRPSMGLQREFGDVAATGMREGAPVTQGGASKITGRLRMSADQAKQLISDAEMAGAPPVQTSDVAAEFGDVFKQGRAQAELGRPDPRPAVHERLRTFDAKNPAGIPLSRAQVLKSEAQDLATKAYRAEDMGHSITDLSTASDAAMARGLRKAIEARVPAVADVNARTQELIGLQRAQEDALRRNVPGVGSIRTLLGDFIPGVSSTAAIAADRSVGATRPMLRALLTALGQGGEQ